MTQPLPFGGWRRLGQFWAVIIAMVLTTGIVLAILGPPPTPDTTAAAETPPAAEPVPEPAEPPPRPASIQAIPDEALLEAGPHGPVPRIGIDGRTPMRVYSRAAEARADPRPRVAIIVGGLGLNAVVSEQAIAQLPAAVTIALNPYAPQLRPLIEMARGRGMELLLALPLEPDGHPANDAGDRALLTSLRPSVNEDRLLWNLSRFQGYVGVVGAIGSLRGERFAALSDPFLTMQDHLRRRGLLYIDPRPGARSPERVWGRSVDVIIDEPATRREIDLKLAILERLARERGAALGLVGDATPVLLDRIAAWHQGLEGRGVVLAPVSANIRRPESAQ